MMQAEHDRLPEQVKQVLAAIIVAREDTLNAQEIANILLSYGRMQVKYVSLPEQLQQVLLKVLHNQASKLNPQGIANSIYR